MPNTELSEFFSLVSQEKNENKARLKEKISNPESDLANLFEQSEIAHKEITIVSEEISDEKILTEEDQNRLEVFSNLMTTFDSVKEIPEEVKVVRDVELKVIEEPDFSPIVVTFEVRVIVGALSFSVIVKVTACVPFSVADPPVTVSIAIIPVSFPS